MIERGIRIGVQYDAGKYQADIVEGSETRAEKVGWVNVVPRQVIPEVRLIADLVLMSVAIRTPYSCGSTGVDVGAPRFPSLS